MKKLTAIFLSVMLVSGLTACGEKGTAQTTTSAPAAEPAVESTTELADESDSESRTEAVRETLAESAAGSTGGKTLVVYYSATGNTKAVGDYIAAETGADVLELEPVEPYSDADLNWTDDNSRVSMEHDNPDARDVDLAASTVENWDAYETVFVGYPVWWGIAAWPVDGFVKANDFTGKTVISFCTSSSSGLEESGELLAAMAGTGNWLEGERFSSGVSQETVQSWVEGLGV